MRGMWFGVIVLGLCGVSGAQTWTHFARAADRVAAASGQVPALGTQRWLAYHDLNGQAITFNGQSGVVVDGQQAYALGTSGGADRLYAIGRDDGEVMWMAAVEAPFVGSWSTPAVDVGNGAVVAATGSVVRAFDAATGAPRWQTPLAKPVVNASPLVTPDLGARDRVFITDYDPFGVSGRLYCLNADAIDPLQNPWDPGSVVWSVVLGGTSGNTPAYRAGVVYVASVTDESGAGGGAIRAFEAGAVAAPSPLWTFENPGGHGFFGGVCVADDGPGLAVYAASYSFTGGQTAANLVKVNGADGSLRWSVPCNRTAATPIPVGGGRVVVSGGVVGFGSMPSLELFQELGSAATMLWDSALETWVDTNGNGVIDLGEFLLVGGWTHQPGAVGGGGGAVLLAGAVPTGGWSSACTDLYAIDLARVPSDPAFIVGHAIGVGSTPAAAGDVYTIGAGGVGAYGACYADCSGDGALTIADFGCFQAKFVGADPYADCNGDAALTIADFGCFQSRFVAGCP